MRYKETQIKEYKNNYYIQVERSIEDPNYLDFWLCRKNIGAKIFMFGIEDPLDITEVEEICDTNIEEYIETWKDEFEKDDLIQFG